MIKLESLRAALVASNKILLENPDMLSLFVDAGAIVATQHEGKGFEYRYTGLIYLQEFAGHPDAIFFPLLAWARDNQPELLANPTAIGFDAEVLDEKSYDIEIRLPLTESVTATRRQDGGYDLKHHDERSISDALRGFFGDVVDDLDPTPTLVSLYVDDELVGQSPP